MLLLASGHFSYKFGHHASREANVTCKGQENPDFCASGTCGSFPYNPVVGSGTFENGPVGPEKLTFYAKKRE